jgi:hypothetical protein
MVPAMHGERRRWDATSGHGISAVRFEPFIFSNV